jgi:uncharacterized protein YehS (DUF1456 family)
MGDQRHLRYGDVFGLYSTAHKGAVVGNRLANIMPVEFTSLSSSPFSPFQRKCDNWYVCLFLFRFADANLSLRLAMDGLIAQYRGTLHNNKRPSPHPFQKISKNYLLPSLRAHFFFFTSTHRFFDRLCI